MADESRTEPEQKAPEASSEEPAHVLTGARTPQGTMTIVLIYAAATVVLWFYMYYIVLKSDGYLGGF